MMALNLTLLTDLYQLTMMNGYLRSGKQNDVAVFDKRGDKSEYELRYELPEKIKAPVRQGDVIGKGFVVKNGEVVKEFDVVSAQDVKRASLWDLFKRIGSAR